MGAALDAFRKQASERNRANGWTKPKPEPTGPLGTMSIRNIQRVATPGSQRRCYDGCFHPDDWEMVWGPWEVIRTNCTEDSTEYWKDFDKCQVKWEPNE